jgi:hypothetical protein
MNHYTVFYTFPESTRVFHLSAEAATAQAAADGVREHYLALRVSTKIRVVKVVQTIECTDWS